MQLGVKRAKLFGCTRELGAHNRILFKPCLGESGSDAQNPCKHHVSHHVAARLLHVVELRCDVASTESCEHVAVFLRFHKSAVKKLSKKAQKKLRPNEPALCARRR